MSIGTVKFFSKMAKKNFKKWQKIFSKMAKNFFKNGKKFFQKCDFMLGRER